MPDPPGTRTPLTRRRVLTGAMVVADAGRLAALTIRSLAAEPGVKPMAVYHHVANEDEILDGIVDLVFEDIELPSPEGEWRQELRRAAASARAVLKRHPWAVNLLESRTTPGSAQEASLPFRDPDELPDVAAPMVARMDAESYPHLVEFATEHVMKPGYDFGSEFDFGLDLVLDGLARLLAQGTGPVTA